VNGPTVSRRVRELLQHSLGDPAGYPVLTSKWATAELARRLDIGVPQQRYVSSLDEALAFACENGFPTILKRENSYGGMGCYVCQSARQLRRGFKCLRAGLSVRRRLRNVTRRRSTGNPVSQKRLIIQRFHEGELAFSAAVADKGVMLTGLTGIAESVHPRPIGASTVIRAINAPELLQATRDLIAATRCSGFISADFIIERQTGRRYLLEINPRPTPLSHLGRLLGTDLCSVFAARLAHLSDTGPLRPEGVEVVALFPNEWMRDPRSPRLRSAYHDVPVNDPDLIAEAYRRLPLAKRLMIRLGFSPISRSWKRETCREISCQPADMGRV
jgi:predicted ATP-grasp superfamily ATP-dependent carboligase